MSRILIAALFVLTLSAPALADTVPVGATVLPHKPMGAGKPDAISCYREVPIGSHIRDMRCERNSEWARMNALTWLPAGAFAPGPDAGPSMPSTP
jgi:hypothetical protein